MCPHIVAAHKSRVRHVAHTIRRILTLMWLMNNASPNQRSPHQGARQAETETRRIKTNRRKRAKHEKQSAEKGRSTHLWACGRAYCVSGVHALAYACASSLNTNIVAREPSRRVWRSTRAWLEMEGGGGKGEGKAPGAGARKQNLRGGRGDGREPGWGAQEEEWGRAPTLPYDGSPKKYVLG